MINHILKRKINQKKSFKTRKDRFHIYNSTLRIEGIGRFKSDRIDLKFDTYISKDIECIDPIISSDNFGNYYISFRTVEDKINLEIPKSNPIGIDLGVRTTLTTSRPINGTNFHNQPNIKIDRLERKIRKLDKQIQRDRKKRLNISTSTKTKYYDIPKSKRQIKREIAKNKILRKIHNIKNTYYDTITKQIIDTNPSVVVMETIGTKKLLQSSHYTAKYMVKTSFYDIRCKMENKCNKYNIPFILADSNFPSSQICSCCGNITKPGKSKVYKCNYCGNIMDRDLNAAINLEYLSYDYLGINYLVA